MMQPDPGILRCRFGNLQQIGFPSNVIITCDDQSYIIPAPADQHPGMNDFQTVSSSQHNHHSDFHPPFDFFLFSFRLWFLLSQALVLTMPKVNFATNAKKPLDFSQMEQFVSKTRLRNFHSVFQNTYRRFQPVPAQPQRNSTQQNADSCK